MQNILEYLSTVQISRNVKNKIHNLQIRLEQFTEEIKRAKKYQPVEIALSMKGNTKSSQT